MEPIRPTVDRYLLDLLVSRQFGARDFFETRDGACRVTPPLTGELASTIPHWGKLVGRVAEDVAHGLLEPRPYEPLPPPLTHRHASGGRLRVGLRPRPEGRAVRPERRCAACGKPTPSRRSRTCSAACERAIRVENGIGHGARVQARLRELRAAGQDPAATPEAKAKHAANVSRRCAERKAWDAAHPERPDSEVFRQDIWPAVKEMSIGAMVKATGLSKATCWHIRRGDVVPHPMWWERLAEPCAGATTQPDLPGLRTRSP
jgi:hypothetical protein